MRLANAIRRNPVLGPVCGVALFWLCASASVHAEEAAPVATDSRQTYQADYFTQFGPSTALDMVRRVPGFAIEEADGEVRGFSGAAGNVVFNGARAASKSDSLQAILARIPARRVLRIEVASGDVFGSDFAGRSQVLNVVTSREGGVDGNVKASLLRLHDRSVTPNLEAAVLIRAGASTFNLSAKSGLWSQVEVGTDDIHRLSDGARLEFRDKVNDIREHFPEFAANWAQDGGAGKSAHANLRYAPGNFTLHQTNRVTPTGGTPRDDRLVQDYKPTNYELGGDISRPLGGGALKFVALANRRERDDFDSYFNRIADVTVGGFEQTTGSRYDEVLGKLSWSHPKLLGFSAEIGSELAYNRLDNGTELYLLGPNGARDRIDLPVDQVTVDELRSESYLNLGRGLASGLRLDLALAFEVSRLEVGGDTTAERSLQFFKPGLTLDWKGKRGWHVQASLRRTVAQLNFYDFISSAELANDRVNGGNAALMPQRAWEARLTVERPVLGRGQIKLELGYDRVSALQDRILTPEGFDAPGNIGDGTRKFARMTLDAPLDKLGLKGTRIKLEGGLLDDSVRDPLTGLPRRWSSFRAGWDVSAELRRDTARWSYGAALFRNDGNTTFRIDEVDSFFNSGPYSNAFVEFRPDKRTTFRLDVENLLDTAGQRRRLFFDPNRSAPTPVIEEFRHRNGHVSFSFSLNRTFGGGTKT